MGALQCCKRRASFGLDRFAEIRAIGNKERLHRWTVDGADIQVEASDLAGNVWKFRASARATGAELRAHIATLAKIPQEELRLMLGCSELFDDEKLQKKKQIDSNTDVDEVTDMLLEQGESTYRAVQLTMIRSRKYFAVVGHWEGSLVLWDLDKGSSEALTKTPQLIANDVAVICVVADWTSRVALSGSMDGALQLWDIQTATCSAKFGIYVGELIDLQVGWPLQRAVGGYSDGNLRVWDLRQLSCLNVVCTKKKLTCLSIGWTDDVALLGLSNGSLKLWKLHGNGSGLGDDGGRWKGHLEAVRCISVNWAASEFVSGSADCRLRLWSMEEEDCVRVFRGHTAMISCLSVDWNSRRFLSGSASPETMLMLWDCDSGTCLVRCPGHAHSIIDVCVDWLSLQAVTCSGDGTLKVWNLLGIDASAAESSSMLLQCTKTLRSDRMGAVCMTVTGCS